MNKSTHDVASRHLFLNSQAHVHAAPIVRQLDNALRILRIKQLVERTNLSRATLYVLMASDPTFPKKIKLTARSIGFLESEVDAWIAARAELRNAA
ncbi:helix-turn-helix transcriptional regulator [Burkholderia pseudomallei]|uniref:helix-turn-helix transcriptional regulator n=1 Tax=Burkholderia pseudomallei TaxID=28450 RepID=UPI00053844AF|nr:AlpA family transcriptional regulator [Burkholderia pseudomallei]KGV08388.1 prophage CP4-57 regulatory family protein [Burkholderia pseudomallei MSHR4503]